MAKHSSSTVLYRDCVADKDALPHWIRANPIFMAYVRPAMMMSDCRHHSSDEALRPIGALRYLNRPCGIRKVVSLLDVSSNASWKYPWTASSLQKSLASGGIASMISLIEGNGCVGLHTNLFSPCLLYTSPSPRDRQKSRMPSSA